MSIVEGVLMRINTFFLFRLTLITSKQSMNYFIAKIASVSLYVCHNKVCTDVGNIWETYLFVVFREKGIVYKTFCLASNIKRNYI